MKKVILAISAIAMSVAANAQEFTAYKPFQGNFTTEMGLTGGIFNSEIKLSEGALLRGRYFVTDQTAVRLGLNVTNQTTKENFYKDLTSSVKGVATERNSAVVINAGYEKHFKGTNRLSPYVGGDVLLGFGGEKISGELTNGNGYVENFYMDQKSSSFSWGVRALVGADYYFAKNVYLGVEAGLGFMSTKFGKTTRETEINGVKATVETKSPGSTFELAPSVVTGVRLGFVF